MSEWAAEDPVVSVETLRRELTAYDPMLHARPFAVVPTKLDVLGPSDRLSNLQAYCKRQGYPCLPISAATNQGLDDLIKYVGTQVDSLRKASCETSS